jgi:hypothetical protein
MEIKVNIPDGRYCNDCKFKISKQCAYLHGVHLSSGFTSEIKANDCPNRYNPTA